MRRSLPHGTVLDTKNFIYIATQAWQSKTSRSAEKMKTGRNGGIMHGPRGLTGVGLIQLTLCLRLSHNCDVRGRTQNAAVAYLRQDREAS